MPSKAVALHASSACSIHLPLFLPQRNCLAIVSDQYCYVYYIPYDLSTTSLMQHLDLPSFSGAFCQWPAETGYE